MNDDERLARVRDSAAGLLYVRNRVAGELASLRVHAARLNDAMAAALLRGDEPAARALALRKAARVAEAEHVERELAEAQGDAAQALAALVALHEATRARERERLRSRAAQLSVAAAVAREIAEDPLEARFRALERV